MERIIVFFAKKTMLVNIIVMAILFVGGYYYFNLQKESIPSTDLDKMLIAVTYPGATPLDVEQNAVIPIEEELQGISGIDEYETTIIENVAIIIVTLDETLPDRQPVKDEVFRQMQNVPDLSEDVEEVTTYDLNPNKKSIYTLAVHFKEGMSGNERELFDVSQMLENELVRLEGVGEIRIDGRTDPEIKVYVDPIKMQQNYIALSDVVNALSVRNVRATGGDMESGGKEQTVVTYGEFENPLDASNAVIRSTFNGQRVRVSDIGHVEEGFEDKTVYMRVNRASGYSLSVVKNENADILKTINVVNQYLKDNADLIPENIQVTPMGDDSRTIKSLLDIVTSNLIQGFIVIFITLIIFLDFKSAMFTSLGMIITMFACFIYMKVTGITFNMMSLAAIITVLGMIVDNSIVVSENIFNFKQAGYKGLEATRLAVSDVVMPMLASTLTTVAAFFPMLTISGIMGKILNIFPKIVIFTLVMSMLQAILLLPNQLQDKEDKYKSYKPPKKKSRFKNPLDFDKDALFDKMKIPFGAALEKLIHIRYIVVGAFVALLIASVFLAQNSFKNFVLIYDTSADTIVINIEMPTGTTKEVTTKEIAKIEDVIAKVVKPEELVALYSLVGKQVDQEVVSEEKGSLAGIMVYLVPAAERNRTADELVVLINEELDKTDIRQTVPIFSMDTKGSVDPGDPVDIRIVGNKTELAKQAKVEIKDFLATIPGVINIDDDDKVGKEELRIMLDYDKIAELGVDVATVANEARAAYYGIEATYIQELENKLNFRVVFDDKYTYDMQYLTNLLIPNSSRRLLYLHNLATIQTADGLATLKHYNGERTIKITADIEYGKNTSQKVMNAVREKFKDFSKQYRGLKLVFGGEAKETVKALKQLAFSFAMAFIFVYIVLLLQLNRFIQPIMIMIIIPFGLIGVLLGFAIHRMPLSFMGVVGIIGLAGVVVNNGIILVDLINKLIDEGVEGGKKGVAKAIVDGAKQRLRPVFLTTVTTVIGLLPTVYGIGGRADIIIPIVMALAYGLLFASLLTLIFLPCMFMIMFDLRLIKIPPTKTSSEEITTTVTTTTN
ncbi:efflux RND transporter permease subunit [Brachyspira alvinipulli]|uniref:efflux RND transporter permease subunit n=1 Tax=Brachyspira alvinipulli TaxID=84379 RepID=UPI000488B290|nr:efflux RND transporter permease subunit [Brachyspira alvinipulli]